MTRPPTDDLGYQNRKREEQKKQARETCPYCRSQNQTGDRCTKCGAPMKGAK